MTVSSVHELLVAMIVDQPGAVARLLGLNTVARTCSNALSTTDVAELRADAVIELGDPIEELVIVEVQTSADPSKPAAWASYVAVGTRRWGVPVRIVVLAMDEALADRYRGPTRIGASLVLDPTVIGPAEFADLAASNDGGSSDVTTLMASVANPSDADLAMRALRFATGVDSVLAPGYTDLVLAAVTPMVREILEEQMRIEPSELKSQLAKDLYAARAGGVEQGLREALRSFLAARGWSMTDAQRASVDAADAQMLEGWIVRASTADVVDDVFD